MILLTDLGRWKGECRNAFPALRGQKQRKVRGLDSEATQGSRQESVEARFPRDRGATGEWSVFDDSQCYWEMGAKDRGKLISCITQKQNFHEDKFSEQSKVD